MWRVRRALFVLRDCDLGPSPALRASPPASGRGEELSLLPLAGEEAREARR
jgi:hypothetical protein